MEKQQQKLQTVIVLVVVVVFTGSACLARWLAAHTSNSLREAAAAAAVAVVKFINLRWRITPTGWPRSARGFLYSLLIRHVRRGSSRSYIARYRFSQSWRVDVFFFLPSLIFCLSCDSEWRLRRLEAKLKALQESLIEKVKEFQLTVDICYFYFDNAARCSALPPSSGGPSILCVESCVLLAGKFRKTPIPTPVILISH